MALLVWLAGLFPDWSPLLPYMADGTAHYAEKVGDTQQGQMTKHNKDTDILKFPDIRKILINNTKIIHRNNNKNHLQNPRGSNYKKYKNNLTINKIAFKTGINRLNIFNN